MASPFGSADRRSLSKGRWSAVQNRGPAGCL